MRRSGGSREKSIPIISLFLLFSFVFLSPISSGLAADLAPEGSLTYEIGNLEKGTEVQVDLLITRPEGGGNVEVKLLKGNREVNSTSKRNTEKETLSFKTVMDGNYQLVLKNNESDRAITVHLDVDTDEEKMDAPGYGFLTLIGAGAVGTAITFVKKKSELDGGL